MTSLRAAQSGTGVFFSAPRAASRAPAFRRLPPFFFRAASREPRARAHLQMSCYSLQASKQATCYTTLALFATRSSTSLCFEKRKKRKKRRTERERVSARTREQAQERESKGGGKLESPKASKPEGFHFVRCRTNVVRI